jgi:hypothetical protein
MDAHRHRLFAGLARVTGLPENTPFADILGSAIRSGNCFSPACTAASCAGAHATALAYLRQSIPEPHPPPRPAPHPDFPDDRPGTMRCPCGQPIVHAHVVYDLEEPDINAVVGSCCVRHFLRVGRNCGRCRQPHKNRSDNFCKACRALVYCAGCRGAKAVEPGRFCAACEDQAVMLAGPAARRGARFTRAVRDRAVELMAERQAAEAERRRAEADRLRAAGLCLQCGEARVRLPYEVCYPCRFPSRCEQCGAGCGAAFKVCFRCSRG